MESIYEDIRILQEYVTLDGVTLSIHVYEWDGMLIDTGSKSIAAQVQSFFERHAPEQALITHFHEDHCGMAGWLQKKGLPIYIHPMSVETAAISPVLPPYRTSFWGVPDPFQPHPLRAVHNTNRYQLQVIETPGHAEDHVVLYDAERGRLFSGDLFLGSKVKICIRTENMPKLRNSLRHVLTLDFDTICCAHAGIITDGKQRLREKLTHLEEIEERIRTRYEQGWSLREITRELFPKRPLIYHLSHGEWSPIHIVHSFFKECRQRDAAYD
ncbi:MBL fold metallo-hydrolase [Aneurinibacillus sp. REN35]|uniref:MBL fold metallo-hydrolase n=1 Tax=Aneurinibacillus sp. REN35 TaxID=3237286 RepID=UPI003527D36D